MKTKQITLIIIFILFATIESKGETGRIIVYNEDGSIDKEVVFEYDPAKEKYVVPEKIIEQEPDIKAPKPPSAPRIVEPEPYVNFQEGWKKKPYKEMSKKEQAVWRKMTKYQGRTRVVTKVESRRIGNQQITTIHRREKDKRGRRFKTKETIIDNRYSDR